MEIKKLSVFQRDKTNYATRNTTMYPVCAKLECVLTCFELSREWDNVETKKRRIENSLQYSISSNGAVVAYWQQQCFHNSHESQMNFFKDPIFWEHKHFWCPLLSSYLCRCLWKSPLVDSHGKRGICERWNLENVAWMNSSLKCTRNLRRPGGEVQHSNEYTTARCTVRCLLRQ